MATFGSIGLGVFAGLPAMHAFYLLLYVVISLPVDVTLQLYTCYIYDFMHMHGSYSQLSTAHA